MDEIHAGKKQNLLTMVSKIRLSPCGFGETDEGNADVFFTLGWGPLGGHSSMGLFAFGEDSAGSSPSVLQTQLNRRPGSDSGSVGYPAGC
jgi:hypothetical protein